MNLTIAIGKTESGEIRSLYVGQLMSETQDAIVKAGEDGAICQGYVYRTLLPVWYRNFAQAAPQR